MVLRLGKLLARLRRPQADAAARGLGFAGTAGRVNLALQGGGAHGAFTWGVLDRLLADGRLAIDSVSGASAGAINAVMLVDGLARGGPAAARDRLAAFWRAASFDSAAKPQREALARLFALTPRQGSPLPWLGALAQVWSPYDFNPLNLNPLQALIERLVDFAALRADARRELFIAATNVQNGERRLFSRAEISAYAVMASACLPTLFQAVEIDGVPHWDGGYSDNPPLLPFLRSTTTEDVLIVQINPLKRGEAPTRANEIATRINELTFNAPLLNELRTLAFAERLIEAGGLPRGTGPGQYRRLRLHRIAMEPPDAADHGSKLNNGYDFLDRLRQDGEAAAARFLDAHLGDIGRRSTIDHGTAPATAAASIPAPAGAC